MTEYILHSSNVLSFKLLDTRPVVELGKLLIDRSMNS